MHFVRVVRNFYLVINECIIYKVIAINLTPEG